MVNAILRVCFFRKLSVYPNGNKERGGQGHISLSLTLVDTSSLPAGWEVKTIFNLFIFDQVRDKYFNLSGNILVKLCDYYTSSTIASLLQLHKKYFSSRVVKKVGRPTKLGSSPNGPKSEPIN